MHPSPPPQPLRRRALLLFLCLTVALAANAQMLFSENLTMKIDSNKPIQGMLSTMVNYKTEHEELFEFKIHSNLNILLGQKSVINLMGRFEFTTYGSKTTVNEGDLHAEYRYLLHPAFEVYPYVEAQWAGTHGLLRKVSTGLQARYRTLYTPHSTMFLTTALYYEAEDWRTSPATPLGPPTATTATSAPTSPSATATSSTNVGLLTTSLIHQANPRHYLSHARFGGTLDLKYKISKVFGLRASYHVFYDTAPVVPMRKMLTFTNAYLDISF